MENSKPCETLDRLSELPDSLIFDIFSFLPITDVVRTTILSKRWEDLWKTLPFLNLDDSNMKFSNWALLLWKGTKILKFTINFEDEHRDIDVWLRFAVDKEVAELELNQSGYPFNVYTVPQCVYSCSSLQALSLKGCFIRINGDVKWDRLKSLTIDAGHDFYNFPSQSMIDQILCGSPNLSVLIFSTLDFREKLCFRSTSLKKLSVVMYPEEWPWGDGELEIWTPKLETLEISGATYRKCSLSASSLTHLTLRFHDQLNYLCDELNELLQGTLIQILSTIGDVESVTLGDWCVKVRVLWPTYD